jgi:Meiotically up-regulated gene 113
LRDQILAEIKRLAVANGGQALGVRAFENATGITEGSWRGRYWAKWGDAIVEAGLIPNAFQSKHERQFFHSKIAEACRHYTKMPTSAEFRMYQQIDPDFPNVKSITREFFSLANIPTSMLEWAKTQSGYEDIAVMFVTAAVTQTIDQAKLAEGLVYLIKSGAHFKIGRSEELERRVKEIRTALPEAASLVHSIRTDDPAGIEAYWHRRFADRRANGEWFKLSNTDVAAFKRRKYQ